MRVRNLLLAVAAMGAIVLPARADILLNWHVSSFVPTNPSDAPSNAPGIVIPSNVALGAALTGPNAGVPNSAGNPFQMVVGQVYFLQLAINGNATPPTNVGGQNQPNWGVYNHGANGNPTKSMIAWGFDLNYPLAVCTNPVTDTTGATNNNFRVKNFDFQPDGAPGDGEGSSFGVAYPSGFTYNTGTTRVGALDTGTGLFSQSSGGLLPDWLLCTFKIRATAAGTGQITLTDPNPAPTVGSFGLGDNTNFDTILYNAGRNFPLFVNVTAVPEPSSMCLAGLAVVGFGWRKLRRKATTAV